MRIAITGATGFVGRHVLGELAKHSHDVVAVSRRPEALPPVTNGRWVEMDVSAPPVNGYEALGRPDVLIHLAWEGLPNYRSDRHLAVELPRQAAFLKGMIEQGLPALLVTGTCLEYGPQPGKLDEGMTCIPDTAYGAAKHDLQQQLMALRQTEPFAFTWARLFYLFGDGQNDKSLWRQFSEAHRRGAEAFDMSGGEQLRDFLPVETAARRLVDLALMRCNLGVLNVCSGRPISVRRIVEQWAHDLGWNVRLNLGAYPYPDYEAMAFWGDATKLLSVLDSR